MVYGRSEYPNLQAELRLRNAPATLLTSLTRKGTASTAFRTRQTHRRLPPRLRDAADLGLPSNNDAASNLSRGNLSALEKGDDDDSCDNSDDDATSQVHDDMAHMDDILLATQSHHHDELSVARTAALSPHAASTVPPRLHESNSCTLANAREKALKGSSCLSHSQSEPTLPSRCLDHRTNVSNATPVMILGHGRLRVRYARRKCSSNPSQLRRLPAFLPAAAAVIPPLEEDNETGFFLTEMDLDSAYVPLAKGLALGAYQLYGQCHIDAALTTFRSVLRAAEELDDIVLQALVCHHMGTAEKDAGDLSASRASHTKCIQLAQSVHHAKLQGRGFKGLGVVCVSSQQYSAAYDYHVKCMVIATSESDHELASRTHANLGNVFAAKRQYVDAIASHTNDLSLSTQLDSYVGMARAHRNLALVYAKMNDVAQQRHHEAEAAAKGPMPFLHDMTHHAHDVVGNLYCQATVGTAMAKVAGQFIEELVRDLK
ncbi:hypothetical protein H310_03186 [Aphanomyces invadans]|uniref:MalT-like TPR region domain-containing protein n=1 Tax=Aphanomyces invadans TaxID=157072 RepID=A0A024UGX8_9STRA|nr:hypothetical protein H310_03186 [Aphanomyces invadans]ETW05420.1 hypothetical protein H310_03186 [Aphanomyces invadans]|eukprot:XP_008865197.1 hypothetical protein H310_03186 [Aphanomyces invadans]